MSISAVIVDDEYLAIKILEQYSARIPGLTILKTFKNPLEALEYLRSAKPDILFLDIQMPHLNGFELLKEIQNPPIAIFTTARHDYAVKAFELDVIDYLVKPISEERFRKALQRASEYLEYKNARQLIPSEFIMIRSEHRVQKIMLNEIEYLEGLGEYVKLHTTRKLHITYGALKDFQSQLPSRQFVRAHKSYIVSKAKIKSFKTHSIELVNGKEIPVGRAYKEEFLKAMKE